MRFLGRGDCKSHSSRRAAREIKAFTLQLRNLLDFADQLNEAGDLQSENTTINTSRATSPMMPPTMWMWPIGLFVVLDASFSGFKTVPRALDRLCGIQRILPVTTSRA